MGVLVGWRGGIMVGWRVAILVGCRVAILVRCRVAILANPTVQPTGQPAFQGAHPTGHTDAGLRGVKCHEAMSVRPPPPPFPSPCCLYSVLMHQCVCAYARLCVCAGVRVVQASVRACMRVRGSGHTSVCVIVYVGLRGYLMGLALYEDGRWRGGKRAAAVAGVASMLA